MAMMPASVMTMAMTKASRGRSMKMLENIVSVSRHDARRHDLTGTHLLYPLDNHQFSLLETVRHDNFSTLLDAGRHAAQLDLLRLVDHQDIAAGLIELDGGLRNHQRRSRCAPFRDDADDPTGDQKTLRVRHLRPHRDSVRGGLDLDVEQVGEAGMRIGAAIGQLDVNGHLRVLDARFDEPALVVDYIALAWLKDDIDGVLPDDRRKRPGRRADQIAHGEISNPDPSIDR